MKRIIASLVLVVTLCACICSSVEIDEENRVPNRGSKEEPGYCAWACLEMLGRQHEVEPLYDLVAKRAKEYDFMHWDRDKKTWVADPYVWVYYKKGKEKEPRCAGGEIAVINKLDQLKVKYRIQRFGNKDTAIIKYAMDNKLGCMIAMLPEAFDGPHAVLLTHFNDKEIKFIDPNDISTPYKVDRAWFDKYWTGYAVVIEKK
jgi:hypothetical protein